MNLSETEISEKSESENGSRSKSQVETICLLDSREFGHLHALLPELSTSTKASISVQDSKRKLSPELDSLVLTDPDWSSRGCLCN